MNIFQHSIQLKERRKGFHIITDEVLHGIPEISKIAKGMCQVFLQHTSASLILNEDAAPAVRKDFEMYFNKTVPENDPQYSHDDEGPDDMPAHLKTGILGNAVLIPVINGRLALGTWQGIYLCEHRTRLHKRNVVITLWGE
jgi:secondary thiamine-phosphate synthase enzyme